MSTGNQFIEIDLSSAQTTLIVGKNGNGKSTLIEALTYVLYGKALRKINIPQLINSITNKNLLVEVEFDIGKDEYMIRRGMKPTIFEIIKNDEKRKPEGVREDQTYIEDKILKMNFKSYTQNVVLGPTNYVPFMSLTAGDRRKIVENLLDIQIFTVMNEVLKTRVTANNEDIKDINYQISLIENKIDSEKKRVESHSKDLQTLIDNKTSQIAAYRDLITSCQSTIKTVQDSIDSLSDDAADLSKIQSKKDKLIGYEASIDEKRKKLKYEINFFETHDDCPTCRQIIDNKFKEETVAEHKKKTEEFSSIVDQIETEINSVNTKIAEISAINKKIYELNEQIAANNQEIRSTTQYINSLQDDISNLSATMSESNADNELPSLTKDLNKANAQSNELITNKAVLSVAAKLLKDTGIKTRIISQYIPVINKLINQYLEQFNLFVDFRLDENFNETVKSRYRDTFSYESFSEGEKARLNLAILFTWRAIAKMRNSVSTNLLIMDEILDSATDLEGIEALMEIIHTMSKNENIIIISHSEKYNDQFERIIKFDKVSNFTQIEIVT